MSLLSEIGLKVTNYLNNIKLYATKDSVANPTDCYFDFTEFYTNIIVDFEDRISDLELDLADLQSDVADIEVDVADLQANQIVIQEVSHRAAPTSDITNSSTTTYVSTGMLVAITPKSAVSKLVISAVCPFSWLSSAQRGFKYKIQKNVGGAGWTDILYGDENYSGYIRLGVAADNERMPNMATEIDSPGISDEIQFRVVYAAHVAGNTVTVEKDKGMHYLNVKEVLQ